MFDKPTITKRSQTNTFYAHFQTFKLKSLTARKTKVIDEIKTLYDIIKQRDKSGNGLSLTWRKSSSNNSIRRI